MRERKWMMINNGLTKIIDIKKGVGAQTHKDKCLGTTWRKRKSKYRKGKQKTTWKTNNQITINPSKIKCLSYNDIFPSP